MKKLVLGLMCLFIFSSCVFAQDNSNFWSKYSDYRNQLNQQQPNSPQKNNYQSQESVVDNEDAQSIYEDYGCVYSPSYLNRDNIDAGPTNSGFSPN